MRSFAGVNLEMKIYLLNNMLNSDVKALIIAMNERRNRPA